VNVSSETPSTTTSATKSRRTTYAVTDLPLRSTPKMI
jgi:hypothetical protein